VTTFPADLSASGGSPARLTVRVDGTAFVVEIEERREGGPRVRVDGRPVDVDARLPRDGPGSVLLDGVSYLVDVDESRDGTDVASVVVDGETFRVQIEDPTRRGRQAARSHDGAGQRLVAPMPGKVVAVLATVGQPVEPGSGLVVLEAMKMENEFRATSGGVVAEIHVAPGQAVNAGDLLVVVR
jgi:biotin carboxyl carrier protein